MSELRLQHNRIGAIAYTLWVDGKIEERILAEEPIEYLHGAENLLPSLEDALIGREAGSQFALELSPKDGYGEYDSDAIETIDRAEFELDTADIQVGDTLDIWKEGDDDIYEEVTVLEITDTHIKLDFNHPLAGKTLTYEVEVVDVREATAEEIAAGMPASLMDEMLIDIDDPADSPQWLNHRN